MDAHNHDKRRAVRARPEKEIPVNPGDRRLSGFLRDVSVGGASIRYDGERASFGSQPQLGEQFELITSGKYGIISEVVRTFDDGYAVRFKRR